MGGWRFLVPNSFTAASAVLAVVSVVLSLEGRLELAAWMALWCVLLDKADGSAARLLKASSEFGLQFDSMADLIAFGLAPAVLTYCTGRQAWGIAFGDPFHWVLASCAVLYVLMAAVRLARFNVRAVSEPSARYFEGVTTTLCGGIVCTALLVGAKWGWPVQVARYFPLVLVLLGLSMVSRIPLPKIVSRRSRAFNVFQLVAAGGIYVCGVLMILPEYLLALALFYLLVGSTYGLLRGPARAGAKDAG
ncbi:MAG TPA: CDP-alcohol phosphatidyltransferase family protein [Myxococcota bacterium]|nr:CDP-alcohol phosphatidyltransferase family protein [Myxococcota bacterium]HRY92362.1 CDP-alcohol phosphatidyltransferase family protein [Myxococcota bacterium]